ncbi:MAG: MmgE/PrpD family protein, partial [Comamonadaceae bacterium]
PLDILIDLVNKHDIRVDEIESLTAYGEGWAYVLPSFIFRDLRDVPDAQFSFAHGLALAAHRIEPGPKWQTREAVFDPSVMKLMDKVKLEIHPDYAASISKNPSSRPSRVEIKARGQVFSGERNFPKGTPSSEPDSFMTTEEIGAKFRSYTRDLVDPETAEQAIDAITNLERVEDFGSVMRSLLWKASLRT